MATTTTNFNLTKPADTDPVDIVTLEGDNMDKIDTALQDNKTPTFSDYNSSESGMPSESQALTNIKSKATLSTLFQNIKAYLKKACTVGQLVTNCTSSSNTLPLAASQGKVLQDQITTLNRKTNNVNFLTYRIDGNNQKEIDYKQFGSPAFLVLFISRGVVNTNEIIFVDAWGSNNIVAGSSSYVQILVDNNMITIKNDSDAGVNCIAMIGYNSI